MPLRASCMAARRLDNYSTAGGALREPEQRRRSSGRYPAGAEPAMLPTYISYVCYARVRACACM